ncbi:long-chain-fatty-acid--CoA ligase [Rhodococcus sp. T2V]|uniref:long-chain-fatty-acid--CoA ligase n=1 Tax=Rhodococcus sp. T2V TaxID=3034164 RepID=UPI0023E2FD7E|nr:long-chain-fatty-acid--CoA ligase [Rhodococcus sp. T2V]MDF3311891.1 long-chain-fatty-acid--CoA ligase [Rhodococcus sp. T2V]
MNTGIPIPGLMMDFPLTVHHLLRRMRDVYPHSKVDTVRASDGTITTASYADVVDRASRLAAALTGLGVKPGDRVGTFAWNTQEHLECYYGVMCLGAVLHTINLRLHNDQIGYTVRHADDRVILLDASLAEQFAPVLRECPGVEHVIVVGDLPEGVEIEGAISYENLISQAPATIEWQEFDETAAAALCYTSGTTGDPKGVLYSHRSILLHALSMSGTETFRISNADRVLSIVPMFHAMGWGLPFVCALSGADLVMPGRFLQPDPVITVVEQQYVTWSCGVPTVWMDVLKRCDQLAAEGVQVHLSSLRRILSGGTQVPTELMRAYREQFDVEMVQGWGMTEIFPGATVGSQDSVAGQSEKAMWDQQSAAGRLSPLYELRVVDSDNATLRNDGIDVGEIEVRGPTVASAYFNAPDTSDKFHDGWLRTGDVGTVSSTGWLRISDRSKDAIKSGGEWISSVDLEAALMDHKSVREAAVVGRPDDRWSERPYAFVVTDRAVSDEELRAFLSERVARWWLPDAFETITSIPRTSTGKFDKKQLRQRLLNGTPTDQG